MQSFDNQSNCLFDCLIVNCLEMIKTTRRPRWWWQTWLSGRMITSLRCSTSSSCWPRGPTTGWRWPGWSRSCGGRGISRSETPDYWRNVTFKCFKDVPEYLQKSEEYVGTRATLEPGLNFCKGMFEWYSGNPNNALKMFNKVRLIHNSWNSKVKYHFVTEVFLS